MVRIKHYESTMNLLRKLLKTNT